MQHTEDGKVGSPRRKSEYKCQGTDERILDDKKQQIITSLSTKKKLIAVKSVNVRGNSIRRI